ncbi:hypothetical protein D7035_23010, partial [Aquimarina sp. AD1]
MQKPFLILFLIIVTLGCNTKKSKDQELDDFVKIISGNFSSKKQSKQESGYSAVNLYNYPIWENRSGYWFYQELFDHKNNTSVYNQRIVHIKRVD